MLLTLVTAVVAGVGLMVLSARLAIPAIVVLLAGGYLLGPEMLNLVRSAALGTLLPVFVSLAVGVILFEGGLSLDIPGYRKASGVIRRLLSMGVLITWFSTALTLYWIVGLSLSLSLMASSLVIVTGPTVVTPILRRLRLKENLHNILQWEAVLIDPIGVFIAVLCYEWLVHGAAEAAISNFAFRIIAGIAFGFVGGMGIRLLLRRRVIPEGMTSVSVLAGAVLIFGISELILIQSGLLAAIVGGLVVGAGKNDELKQVKQFKSEISELMIGMLFILLASRLKLSQFESFGTRGFVAVAVVLFVIRPLNILLCTAGSDLGWRDKVFLSWMAPRGIVAASMASLIRIRLENQGGELPDVFSHLAQFFGIVSTGETINGAFIETFTYSVIISTIVLHGFSAAPLSRMLKLLRPEPTGWVIVGAHRLGRELARFIRDVAKKRVIIVDSNARSVERARSDGHEAVLADARSQNALDAHAQGTIGNAIALTDNEDLNAMICQKWAEIVGTEHVFRWNSGKGETRAEEELPGHIIWQRLPKPGFISRELDLGEASLIVDETASPELCTLAIPIALSHEGNLRFELSENVPPQDEKTAILYLQRRGDFLLRSLRRELVIRSNATTRDQLFDQLAERVVNVVPQVSRTKIVEELNERERLFSTEIGHGIAVPHTYSPQVKGRLCVIAHLPHGLDFGHGGEPIRLVFLLVSPPGDPEGHLATLAEIAHLVSRTETASRMMEANSEQQLFDIIAEADRQYLWSGLR
jgi:NhaP-type Na+/H+ or K+/H+ antiporter/mannitol/fructose-specific phosphotransferase system IIA component (Ntr-type)